MTTRILEDGQGRQTFELPCQNTIRFRWVTLEDGSVAPQTNTRCAPKPLDLDLKNHTQSLFPDSCSRQTFELPCQNTTQFFCVTLEDGSVAPLTNTRWVLPTNLG